MSKYVGLPFAVRGRTLEGCDCWGLVRLVLAEEFGKELPSFLDEYTEIERMHIADVIAREISGMGLQRVDVPQEGDLVLMHPAGVASHVGIYVGDDYILHSDPTGKGLSRLERASIGRIALRTEGYYRVG